MRLGQPLRGAAMRRASRNGPRAMMVIKTVFNQVLQFRNDFCNLERKTP